jgi:integrase
MAALRSRPARDRKGRIRSYYSIRLKSGSELGVGCNKRVAELLLAEYQLREEFGRRGVDLPVRSSWTLTDLKAWDMKLAIAEGGETASRKRRWEILLSGLGAETRIEALTPAILQAFVDRRLDAAGPATINRDLTVLRKAFARARDPRSGAGFAGDPMRGIPTLKERAARKKPTPRTPAEIDALLAAGRRLAAHPPAYALAGETEQDLAIFELLYLTGSRKSQVLRLRRDQVLEHPTAGKLLYFPPHKRGKARYYRYGGRLAEILDSIENDGSGWFFASKRNPGHPREDIRRFLYSLAREAEVPRLTAHTLRHSLSSGLLAAGVPVSGVQGRLGHKTRRTTEEEYAEVFPEIHDATPPPPSSPALLPPDLRHPKNFRGNARERDREISNS